MTTNKTNTKITLVVIFILSFSIMAVQYMFRFDEVKDLVKLGKELNNKKSGNNKYNTFQNQYDNNKEAFSPFNSGETFKSILKQSDIACNLPQPSKRYMYQPVPPARNSSYDVRNAYFTPAADKSQIGIFKHTDIFGNYANERSCPNYQQMESKILMQ